MTASVATPEPDLAMPTIPLTLMDRCDRCGAQAFVRASVCAQDTNIPVDLLFCKHHYVKYEERLTAAAVYIQDDSDKINVKPSPSANTT